MQPSETKQEIDNAEKQAAQLARELDTVEGLERISREAYEFIHENKNVPPEKQNHRQ